MAYQRIRAPRLSDSIAEQLEQLILEGGLKPGERLPSERELAQRLEVSRPSLREAILKLKTRDLVESRRGGGTYVKDIVAGSVTNPLLHLLQAHPQTVFDVLELRHALEETAAQLAAQRATDGDLQRLRQCYENAYRLGDSRDPVADAQADAEFHLAIAEASHNAVLIHIMRSLFELLTQSISDSLENFMHNAGYFDVVRRHHQEIHAAILARDPVAARAAANTHLGFLEDTLREYQDDHRRDQRASLRRQVLGRD